MSYYLSVFVVPDPFVGTAFHERTHEIVTIVFEGVPTIKVFVVFERPLKFVTIFESIYGLPLKDAIYKLTDIFVP